jgi:hypothetical protein
MDFAQTGKIGLKKRGIIEYFKAYLHQNQPFRNDFPHFKDFFPLNFHISAAN